MQIDITEFFNNAAPMDYSASVAEIGSNAGADTWQAANEDAPDNLSLLPDQESLDAFHEHMQAMGFSEADNFSSYTKEQSIALFMQLISGDMREADLTPDMSEEEWAAYELKASAGSCSGNIYRGDNGRIYYGLGS